MISPWLILALGLLAGGALTWLFVRTQRASHGVLASHLDRISAQLDRRLQENVATMNETKSFLTDRVASSERNVQQTMHEVSLGLGKLDQATSAIHRTSSEIISFQNMLKNPKIRGGFGEVLLSNLLADILPQDRYELQARLQSSGEIADAVIKLQDGYIVAIDAKFPLVNFQAHINELDDKRKSALRKLFFRDIKKHISDIASKYISPVERTLDYAFMYIPVEAVYYETMIHDSSRETLWEFSLQSKVIPVSPNSFLAYLQTVLIGLRGFKIEQQAKEILQHLGQVRQDYGLFNKEFITLGTHLTNAKNKYEDSSRRLDKFSNRFDQIETATHVAKLVSPNQAPDRERAVDGQP